MRVQILPPAPYADVSIMVLPRIANPFTSFRSVQVRVLSSAPRKENVMELNERGKEIQRIISELGDIPCKIFYGKTAEEVVAEIFEKVLNGEIV